MLKNKLVSFKKSINYFGGKGEVFA